ncbi:MAG: T9SS type A sorting domain-containing protein [Cytophagales bacterium]
MPLAVSNETSTFNSINNRLENTALQLPFFDDFSKSFGSPNTEFWENFGGTTISNDYSISPPNINCVVFDGRDRRGNIYNSGDIYAIGKIDSLESKAIDLSQVNETSDLVLSFFIQNGGNGDRSDGHQGDSIWLSFLNSENQWVNVWVRKDDKEVMEVNFNSTTNDFDTTFTYPKDTVFTPYFIAINESQFFHDKFKFKFNTVGRMSGDYDIWLLDYVYLASNRSITDTSFEDRSFSYLNANIFKNYSLIPSSQLFNSLGFPLNESIELGYSNLKKSIEDPIDISVSLSESINNTSLWQKDLFLVTQNNPTIGAVEVNDLPINLPLTPKDSLPLKLMAFFPNSPDLGKFRTNDTVYRNILVHNKLAYDDGTAEVSVTMNRRDAQLAYQFHLVEQDTLTHVQFYLPNVQGKMGSATFDLRVWHKISKRNASGQVISGTFNDLVYNRNKQVVYGDSLINTFLEYKLDTPIVVKDTFYVGYLQKTQYDFYVGFDMNSPIKSNLQIYTNTGRGWEQFKNAEGNLMIRPVFKKLPPDSKRTDRNFEKLSANNLRVVYPNNNLECFAILGSESPDFVYVYDMLGNLVVKLMGIPEGKAYCPQNLRPGVYILVVEKDGKRNSVKMVHQN